MDSPDYLCGQQLQGTNGEKGDDGEKGMTGEPGEKGETVTHHSDESAPSCCCVSCCREMMEILDFPEKLVERGSLESL